jgi:lipopolysaccharide/colanic/teichoic acid biosynthesis glycosyltransferase
MISMTYDQQKRVMDLLVATALIIAFLPFWVIIPLLILIDSGWPVIFTHRRMGKDGKDFNLFKFRSMVLNADEILYQKNRQLLQKFKQGDWKFAAKDDPRITLLGRFLRAFTIDEFPQLFNVLRGEMSMVGPRAYLRKELEEQIKKHKETREYVPQILSVKPGITGPWQTSGRNEIPFEKRAEMDAAYAVKKDIKQDILILLRTPKAMLSKW